MDKKRRTILTVIIAGVLLISVVGTYAFFTSTANNDNKLTGVIKTGTMSLVFSDGNANINESLMFGESVTKKFIIENNGSLEASLSLDWKDLINTYLNGSLSYNLSYSTEENGTYTEIIPETNMPVSSKKLTQTLASELSVPANDTYYYNLTITLNNTDFDQSDDLDAIFNTSFDVNTPVKYRYYSLIVDPNGGTWGEFTGPQKYLLQNEDTFSITGTPTKTGYDFLGWKLSGISSTFEDGTFTMGIGDTKLTAEWSPKSVNVTVDGTRLEDIKYDSTIDLGTPPDKVGHTTVGWSTTGGLLSGNTLKINTLEDIEVTSVYEVNDYGYIVYHNKMNIGGGDYTRVEADTESNNEAPFGSSNTGTPKTTYGLGFGTGSCNSITIGVDITKNIVECNYPRKQFTLTINSNGGTYSETTKNLYYEETTTLGIPTRVGYDFTNWTNDGAVLSDNTFTMGTNDEEIRANYTPQPFSVVFNANGGQIGSEITTSKIVNYDSPYGELPTPTYGGYKFLGWFTENDGGVEVTAETTLTQASNQTLYAHWKETNTLQAVSYTYAEKLWSQKENITKVIFENTMNKPATYAYEYDISSEGDSSVMAYLVNDTAETGKYIAHIQANGKIYANQNSSHLFYNFTSLKSFEGMEYLDTSKVTNMTCIFQGCSNLITLDLSNFNTSNVISVNSMFEQCLSLVSLNLSNFNTSNVTNMYDMFANCEKLANLDVKNFNTSNVTDMGFMFYDCSSLTTLDINNFDTSNVTNMVCLFKACNKLETLNFNFDTSKVTNMGEMFYNCSSLTNLDISHFNTTNVTNMSAMFYNCSSLTSLDLSKFDTSNVTNMSFLFHTCRKLTTLDVSKFDTSNVVLLNEMFYHCDSLTTLDVGHFDTSKVITMNRMFYDCGSLTTLDVSHFNTSNVTDMYTMFAGCYALTALDVSNFDTSKVTNMGYMFWKCLNLTTLDVNNFDTSKVSNMEYMFYECSSLTTLNLSNWNTSSVTNKGNIFTAISSSIKITVNNPDIKTWIIGASTSPKLTDANFNLV